jgi:hypothetical protein
MTSQGVATHDRRRQRFASGSVRQLPLVILVAFSILRTSRGQPSTITVAALSADRSVLDLHVMEELPAGWSIGSIPRNMDFDQKYTPAEMAELRYSLLSKPVIGSELGGSPKVTSSSSSSGPSTSSFDRSLFSVDEMLGTIRTADKLDREALCRRTTEVQHTSSVTVTPCIVRFDVAVRPMTHFRIVRVRVEILDVNDNEPTFPVGSISLALPETAAPGTSLHLPVAVDADSGVNGVRNYMLTTHVDKFRLAERSRNDLRLVVTSPLDRETTAEYRLIVVAVDGGQPSLSGTLQVCIALLVVIIYDGAVGKLSNHHGMALEI